MAVRTARVVAIAGIGFFALRGVLGDMAPAELAACTLLLVAAAALFVRRYAARGACKIGELACREGLLSADRVAQILSLQKAAGGRFGEIAVREQLISAQQLKRLLALQTA